MHECAALAHRAGHDALRRGEREVRRDVADFFDPRGLELRPAPGAEPGQLADAVFGEYGVTGAVCVVGTRVRGEAVPARGDVRGGGTGEHGAQVARLRADVFEQRARLVEHRVRGEKGFEVEVYAVVDVVAVQRQHRGIADVEPGAAQHPELQRRVEEEVLLHPGARLDLEQAPAAFGQALEHVGAHEHPAVLEGRLEERGRGTRVDEPAGLLERLSNVPVVRTDPVAAGVAPACRLADRASGIEGGLRDLVGRAGERGCEGVVPQPERALGAGEVTRLGESIWGHHRLGSASCRGMGKRGSPATGAVSHTVCRRRRPGARAARARAGAGDGRGDRRSVGWRPQDSGRSLCA